MICKFITFKFLHLCLSSRIWSWIQHKVSIKQAIQIPKQKSRNLTESVNSLNSCRDIQQSSLLIDRELQTFNSGYPSTYPKIKLTGHFLIADTSNIIYMWSNSCSLKKVSPSLEFKHSTFSCYSNNDFLKISKPLINFENEN